MAHTRDVADRAGVSRATVSAVVNRNKYVSPELTARVLAAISELNYEPNGIARSLKVKETRTLGLVIPDIMSPFYGPLVRAIEDTAIKHGYTIVLGNSAESSSREAKLLSSLREKRVDGVLLVPCSTENQPLVERMMSVGTPVVFVDRRISGMAVDMVVSDNVRGGYLATSHLLAHGYRRIGFVTFPLRASPSHDRLEGYRMALEKAGVGIEEGLILVVGTSGEKRASAELSSLLDGPSRPEALVACSQATSLLVLRELTKRGLRVPTDVALIGYDDSDWSAFLYSPLTVVRQQEYRMGTRATELLVCRVSGKGRGAPQEVILDVEMVVRASCGCPTSAEQAPQYGLDGELARIS